MNTERFLWPVIIAAGLHGALLLSFADKPLVDDPPKTKDKPWVKPTVDPLPVDLPEPETGSTSETAGGPAPLPHIPDILRPLTPETIFTVPVMARSVAINPVNKLPKEMGDLPGAGDGPGIGPSLPDVGHLDRIPRATVRPAPTYPDAMRKSATNGSVTVEFVVDTTGRVISADAVRWSHREFVDPAVRAVMRWRFEPGTQNRRRVSFRMAVPIEFYAAL